MIETPGYFTPSGGPALGMVHYAPEASAPSRVPVLFVPPLFEERKSSYAALSLLARELAGDGHHVLRFDFRGSGESAGDPATRRWADLAADTAAAVEALQRIAGGDDFALLGLRAGATVALQCAPALKPARVVALAPVLKGKSQARQWRLRSKLRAELTAGEGGGASAPAAQDAGGVIDLDGFPVAAAFIDHLAEVDLSGGAGEAWPCSVDLVQLSFRDNPSKETEAVQTAWQSQTPNLAVHCLRIEAFWDRVDDVDTGPLNTLVRGLFQ